jgi:hypothetical protein
VCRPRTRTGLEREHRIHEEIERQDHVEGDVGADERLIESGDAQSLRLQRHQHVGRVQGAEEDQREARPPIGDLDDVEHAIEQIALRAVTTRRHRVPSIFTILL